MSTAAAKEVVVDLGSVEAHAGKQHTIPPWGGALMGGVGVLLIATSGRRRRN